MSIATKGGDDGRTSLVDGARVSKGHDRVEAYGLVDELIAQLGLARSLCEHQDAAAIARSVQAQLFAVAESLGRGTAATPIDPAHIDELTGRVHHIEQLD